MVYKKKLEELITYIINENGSDLHLSEGRHPVIRVTGSLITLENKPILSNEDIMGFLSELLTPENKEKFLEKKEIDFSYSNTDVRFRGNAFFQRGLIGIALRLIPKKIKTLEELNLPTNLEFFTQLQQGFFLVVGPVGQGKSTTLASLIDIINTQRPEHIITIEDPIEYIYEQKLSVVEQREVGIDTDDFATAMTATSCRSNIGDYKVTAVCCRVI